MCYFLYGNDYGDRASVILLAPILLPVATSFGIHPLHFALVMLVNLNVGLATPPVGVCLFTVTPIAKVLEKGLFQRQCLL